MKMAEPRPGLQVPSHTCDALSLLLSPGSTKHQAIDCDNIMDGRAAKNDQHSAPKASPCPDKPISATPEYQDCLNVPFALPPPHVPRPTRNDNVASKNASFWLPRSPANRHRTTGVGPLGWDNSNRVLFASRRATYIVHRYCSPVHYLAPVPFSPRSTFSVR